MKNIPKIVIWPGLSLTLWFIMIILCWYALNTQQAGFTHTPDVPIYYVFASVIQGVFTHVLVLFIVKPRNTGAGMKLGVIASFAFIVILFLFGVVAQSRGFQSMAELFGTVYYIYILVFPLSIPMTIIGGIITGEARAISLSKK